ncbi:MAG: hypothetical protein QNJ30_24720 [Kiloniellales bacterium]|nr:hypothetical protein [Kiloniellales bacterium]
MTQTPASGLKLPPLAALVLIAWFAVVAWLAAGDAFVAGPGELPWKLTLALLLPQVLFALAYRAFAGLRDFVLSLSLPLITGLQSWRMLGMGFLMLYFWDVLPPLFAYPAGLGDAAVALAAPFLVAAMFTARGVSRRGLIFWNWLGVADFLMAFSVGFLASGSAAGLLAGSVTSDPMLRLPMVLVPAFGVPFFTLLHVISFLQLYRARQETIALTAAAA